MLREAHSIQCIIYVKDRENGYYIKSGVFHIDFFNKSFSNISIIFIKYNFFIYLYKICI